MGIPAPSGVGAAGTPPSGDQANAVVTGSFSAIGPSAPFAFYGSFNVAIWGALNATLTTSAGSATATVGSATGITVGMPINGKNVPPGTTVGVLNGTTVTLAFPPNESAAAVLGGADNAALFLNATWAGTIQLERSFDGGSTWVICGVGGGGASAIYTGAGQAGAPVSVVASEPERQVLYRLNCIAYSATSNTTVNYRLSANGLAAMAWGVPPG